MNAHSYLVLNTENPAAEQCVNAQRIVAAAEPRPFVGFDFETRPDKFLDFCLDPEQAANNACKPRTGPRLRAHDAGETELCGIRYAVKVRIGWRAHADR